MTPRPAKKMRCAVCLHPKVGDINRALAEPKSSTRVLEVKYGVHYKALERHRGAHLPKALTEDIAQTVVAEHVAKGATAQEQTQALLDRTAALLEGAEKRRDYGTAIKAVREMRGCIELVARLAGEINEAAVINVFAAPVWIKVQTNILAALAPYPDARHAVLRALEAAPGSDGA